MNTTVQPPPTRRALIQIDSEACIAHAWTELLRHAGRVSLTLAQASMYALDLHLEAVAMTNEITGADERTPNLVVTGEVLRQRGVISGLRVATAVAGVFKALELGPVVAPLPWRPGMNPDRSGMVLNATGPGQQSGGREVFHCVALVAHHDRLERPGYAHLNDVVEFRPCLGDGWGDKGAGYLRTADLHALLAHVHQFPPYRYLAAGPIWPEEV